MTMQVRPVVLPLVIGCVLGAWVEPLSAEQPAAADRRPNILLAIADDASWPHVSAAGCRAIMTPVFDRVAREGVLFRNGMAASPGCSPSRAALLTGMHHWQLEHAGT